MKLMTSPLGSHLETTDGRFGCIVMPMNGKTFSCRSHAHPITSLINRWGTQQVSIGNDRYKPPRSHLVRVVWCLYAVRPQNLDGNRASLISCLINIRRTIRVHASSPEVFKVPRKRQ